MVDIDDEFDTTHDAYNEGKRLAAARVQLADDCVMAVAQLPELIVAALAAWMVVAGDLVMVDRCVLDTLDSNGNVDELAFAALYAANHERYWGAPWALPQGSCAIDGATGRATLLLPKQLIDAPCDSTACSCPECEQIAALDAAELAHEAGMRGRWVSPGGMC